MQHSTTNHLMLLLMMGLNFDSKDGEEWCHSPLKFRDTTMLRDAVIRD